MSKEQAFDLQNSELSDVFTALTAEVWLDPKLAGKLAANKRATVLGFAREHGYAVPTDEDIEQFEVPPNPVGDLEIGTPEVRMGPTADYSTTCDPCTSLEAGCPSSTCNASYGCPTDGCSWSCWTAQQCSIDCFTVMCTFYGCNP